MKNPYRTWRRRAPTLLIGCAAAVALSWASLAQTVDASARHAILVDETTSTVLYEKDADTRMPPASMSKLMTYYVVFEQLASGRLKLDDMMGVSERAWRTGGSKMFVAVKSRISVEDLLRGAIIQSGNDACVVLAEGLARSETAFADDMNKRGKELGLKDSHFTNATGLPDDDHYMTARDLALLVGRIVRDFPQFYHYFSETNFTYNGIKQGNRNPLLYKEKESGVDGLKTGHTDASGYGLAVSAKRGDRRLILVLNGFNSVNERSREAERLLDWGFREFKQYPMAKNGESFATVPVWLGDQPDVSLVAGRDLSLTLSRQTRRDMKVRVVYNEPLPAPIKKGTELGSLIVELPSREPLIVPLVAAAEVERLSFVGRMGAAVNYLLWGHQAP
ncbi:MAG: D-alanyl-D-alanine carboxypeptidase [Alphaproteobacteria bacterium]|nr:D-alanyl-D-alanine carboxypeptidase [Alphaproteobacteria bacterium]